MGAVFKAEHVRLKRLVAVKVLLGDRLHDDSAVARFDREMEAVGKLDHPNIVRATDAGEDDDTHYLVMELVDGPNLSQLSKSLGSINVADACEVVRQAAAGLQHAHEHGLVHRDIKPSNLILADAGSRKASASAPDNSGNATVKILDLGLALLREKPTTEGELTSSGQVMGTLDYMAPEQASDTHSVDIRADLYSLGCTLYQLLTGSAPFSGSQYSTILKKMMAHAQTPVPPLSDVRSDIPAELSEIVDRMLAKEPAERFSTPSEILAALQAFVGDADLPALLNRYRSAHKSVEHLDTQLQSTITPASSALSDTIDPVVQPKSDSNPPPKVQTDSQLASEPFAPTMIVDAPPQSFANRNNGRGNRRRTWQMLAACGGVLLLGIVFFVGTGEGRVEITVNHPDVQISVDGEPQQIKVMDGTTDEYRIALPNIPAGRRELIVSRDGFTAETRHFWIMRNGERTFEMRLVPNASGSDTNTAAIASRDAQSKPETPKAAVANNLGPAENVLPGLIPRPATIPGMKRWNLEARSIRTDVIEDETGRRHLLTPSEFEHRRSLPGDFSVSDEHADRRFAQWVLDRGGKLFEAQGAFPEFTSADAAAASEAWWRVQFSGLSDFTDSDLETMSRFRPTRRLDLALEGTSVTSAGIRHLQKFNFYSLRLAGTHISDEIADTLSKLPTLNLLDLSDTDMTSACFATLSRLPNLEKLIINGIDVAPHDLVALQCQWLTQLTMLDVKLALNDLVVLDGLPNLQILQLGSGDQQVESRFDDACLEKIGSVKDLKHLTLIGTQITDAGLVHLRLANGLEIVELSGCQITDIGLQQFTADHPNLIGLGIDGSEVTDEGVRSLSQLDRLVSLGIAGCNELGPAGFANVAKLKSLESLHLHETAFSDSDVPQFSDHTSLKHLVIKHTSVSDAAIEHMGQMKSLQVLEVEGTKITPDGIARLRAALPNCDVRS